MRIATQEAAPVRMSVSSGSQKYRCGSMDENISAQPSLNRTLAILGVNKAISQENGNYSGAAEVT